MVDQQCRESKGKAKIEGYMSVSDEEAHHQDMRSWSTKRQEIMSLSMTESEYITVTHGKRSTVAVLIDWSGVWTLSTQHCHHALL